jgi:4-hydroxybenzoate polyprenyltransferase
VCENLKLLAARRVNFASQLKLQQKGNRLVSVLSLEHIRRKTRGLLRLTRWKEYVVYVTPLTAFGAMLALRATDGSLDWRLLVAIAANTLAMAYAFMINDIVDAPDDALEAERAARNPVTCGEISIWEGWAASGVVAVAAIGLYALLGVPALIAGVATLALSHFYSWKPVRLKAYPITDIISHSLMLSGLLLVVGFYCYHHDLLAIWSVVLAMTLVSSYGQLYNQLRDYEMDRAAGLYNTTIMLGRRVTAVLMYATLIAAALLLVYALVIGLIPWWLIGIAVISVPLIYLFRSRADARGGTAADLSGTVQLQVLMAANVAVIVWMIAQALGF